VLNFRKSLIFSLFTVPFMVRLHGSFAVFMVTKNVNDINLHDCLSHSPLKPPHALARALVRAEAQSKQPWKIFVSPPSTNGK
jgi:hypothetical protein